MLKLAPFALLALLAACGADGEPEPPVQPGVTITGDVQAGVVGTL